MKKKIKDEIVQLFWSWNFAKKKFLIHVLLYLERPNVGAVIHSHDPNVVLASMLYKGTEFKIKNQHMIKV